MLWTVGQTAAFLGLKRGGVYYLIYFAYLEAVKVGRAWRIAPGSARAYAANRPRSGSR